MKTFDQLFEELTEADIGSGIYMGGHASPKHGADARMRADHNGKMTVKTHPQNGDRVHKAKLIKKKQGDRKADNSDNAETSDQSVSTEDHVPELNELSKALLNRYKTASSADAFRREIKSDKQNRKANKHVSKANDTSRGPLQRDKSRQKGRKAYEKVAKQERKIGNRDTGLYRATRKLGGTARVNATEST